MGEARKNEKFFEDLKNTQMDDNFSQSPVVSVIKAMGYSGNDDGMCAGIVHLWEQAVLCGEEDNFNQRAIFINQLYSPHLTSESELRSEIEIDLNEKGLYSWLKKSFQEYFVEFDKELNKRMPALLQKKIDSIHTKVKNNEELSLDDKRWLEIKSFAEGVELFQKASTHEEFFGGPTSFYADENKFLLTASHELEKRGGACELYSEPWIFEHDKSSDPKKQDEEIKKYFADLASIFDTEKGIDPFAMSISSTRHRIGIKVSGKDGQGDYLWTVSDPNNMPPKIVSHIDLGHVIYGCLRPGIEDRPDTAIMLKIFTTGNKINSEPIQRIKNKLDGFYQSHEVGDKVKELNKRNNDDLVDVAKRLGHLNIVSSLDPKFDIKKDGLQKLINKVHCRDSSSVNRIINSGVDLNQTFNHRIGIGVTVVHLAAKNGDLATLRILDKHHGDFTKKKGHWFFGKKIGAKTPLDIAKKYHHTDAVNFIESIKNRDTLLSELGELEKRCTGDETKHISEMKLKIKDSWQKCDIKNDHISFNQINWENEINLLKTNIVQERRGQAQPLNATINTTHTKDEYTNESNQKFKSTK